MSIWYRTLGDVGDSIDVELNSNLTDLSAVTGVVAHVWQENKHGKVIVTHDLTAAVSDSARRIVTVQLGTWLQTLATVGDWFVEQQVSFAGGRVLTFPSGAPRDTIRVQQQGA